VSPSILPRFYHLYTNGVLGLTERTDRSMKSHLSSSHVINVPRGNEPDQSEKLSPVPLHMLADRDTSCNQPMLQSTVQKVDTYRNLDELHSSFPASATGTERDCGILSSSSPFPPFNYNLNQLTNDMSSTSSESYDFSPDTASKIRFIGPITLHEHIREWNQHHIAALDAHGMTRCSVS